jgi:hypothetical protein
MTKLNEKQIAAYEAKGFNRWTKGNMDRLYINATDLGAEIDYYKSGNVCSAKWQGESVSNADGRRLLASKVFVDVKTGELSVTTSFDLYDAMSVEDAARQLVASIEAELAEPEAEEEPATSKHAKVEGKRDELVRTVEDFIAERIAMSTGLGLDEDARKRGVAMLEAAREKTVSAIRELEDVDVSAAPLDGNRLVQAYGI